MADQDYTFEVVVDVATEADATVLRQRLIDLLEEDERCTGYMTTDVESEEGRVVDA